MVIDPLTDPPATPAETAAVPLDRVVPPVADGSVPRRRLVWIPVGLFCVGLGGLGVVLPVLPSTVFFIGAAAAFSKSSPRLEAWVLDRRGVGPLVRDYRAGLGMPRRAKVVAIAMMWSAIVVSVVAVDRPLLRLTVVLLGVTGTATIVRVRSADQRERIATRKSDSGSKGRRSHVASGTTQRSPAASTSAKNSSKG